MTGRGSTRARSLGAALGVAGVALLSVLLLTPGRALGAVISVPGDIATLQAAIAAVASNGDVIELDDGIYPAATEAETPDGRSGFFISNRPHDFTIRAAAGATVVLDGENLRPVLRLMNSSFAEGGKVTFEGITFRRGLSQTLGLTAGVTIQRGHALFRDCVFDANRTEQATTGGGGVQVALGSSVTFERSIWSNNSSRFFGGGLTVSGRSSVIIRDSQFLENRSNPPGHHPSATGGGVHVVDSSIEVTRTRFDDNRASFAGGGFYALGTWDDPGGGVQAAIENSTFVNNHVVPDPSVTLTNASEGGGVHVEDLVSIVVRDSRFLANEADIGGGLNGYRADIEVRDSVFRGNLARSGATKGTKSLGGQIAVASNDVNDASTGFGAFNRRSTNLSVEDTLLDGFSAGASAVADVGGCLFAVGDGNRAFGLNGVTQQGTLAENQAMVTLRRVVMHHCAVQQHAAAGSGTGGGLSAGVADVHLEDVLIANSEALGSDNTSGGGMALTSHTRAALTRTTFAGNRSVRFGGALFAQGAHLEVTDSAFLGNELSPGVEEPCWPSSTGSALFITPFDGSDVPPDQPATGFIADSIFSDNIGLPVFDDDRQPSPINDTRYDGNLVFSPSFDGAFFSNVIPNSVPPFSVCLDAEQMSSLVVQRSGGSSSPKSIVPNVDLVAPPSYATLLAVPSRILAAHAAGDPPSSGTAWLGYAWSGASAQLDGVTLTDRAGLLEATSGGHELQVDALAPEVAFLVPEPPREATLALAFCLLYALRRRALAPHREGLWREARAVIPSVRRVHSPALPGPGEHPPGLRSGPPRCATPLHPRDGPRAGS